MLKWSFIQLNLLWKYFRDFSLSSHDKLNFTLFPFSFSLSLHFETIFQNFQDNIYRFLARKSTFAIW